MAKTNFAEKTVRELLDLEQAARLICAKYENLNKMENFNSRELNDKFFEVKEKYDMVLNEIEKRVKAL